jgi:hypothetical protein
MPDVRIDYGALETTRRTLADIGSVLSGSTDAVSNVPAGAVAQADLRDRLAEMSGFWGNSLRKLSGFAEEAGGALEGVVEAFQSVDEQLGSAMENQENGS